MFESHGVKNYRRRRTWGRTRVFGEIIFGIPEQHRRCCSGIFASVFGEMFIPQHFVLRSFLTCLGKFLQIFLTNEEINAVKCH